MVINRLKGLSQDERQKIRQILAYHASRPCGIFVRIDGKYDLRSRRKVNLRRKILKQLKAQGFILDGQIINQPSDISKESIRALHLTSRAEKYLKNKQFLCDKEKNLLNYFADGSEVDLHDVKPSLIAVNTGTIEAELFRYASLLWSVPVSEGFGRRLRFLVLDECNNKLMGIFALGDPVFNLRCRDAWIGWDVHDRIERLYNIMDIFILGAVPPYNSLLAGKLVALAASSNEVRKMVFDRYNCTSTIIQKKHKDAHLALLTTGSALGKSSIYDRITFKGELIYNRIGLSEGFGHFHLNNGIFQQMRDYLNLTIPEKAGRNRFGEGPNWKMRTTRESLKYLGLPENLLRHGIQREIYAIPLAGNFRSFLQRKEKVLHPYDLPFSDIVSYWKERWFLPRAERKPEFRLHTRQDLLRMIHSADPGGIYD
jgi:hypothetical protein